nr:MAG TPA: hypothetical protein [Caudoviricetes sp.]
MGINVGIHSKKVPIKAKYYLLQIAYLCASVLKIT